MDLREWVLRNCKFAAFQAPQKGDRIELPNRPGEYYLVSDRPEVGKDPRGQSFWQARVKDREGKEQMFSSDNIPSWRHFKGQNYDWHDADIQKGQWQKQQKEQAGLINNFENKYRFPDGQPLRKNPGRPMVVSVGRDATGPLAVFADEKLYIKDVDYQRETVSLEPMGEGLGELASELVAVPAGIVVQGTKPAMRPEVLAESVRLPGGNVVTAEDLMYMTRELNKLARMGHVRLEAQVYANYEGKGMTGEQYFVNEMAKRGIPEEEVQQSTNYRINNVAAKLDANGKRTNIFGAWQGNVIIEQPVAPEVLEEIKQIAPESQIQKRRDGVILVQSNALYKQMVSLGILDAQKAQQKPLGTQRPAPMGTPAPQPVV